MDLGKLIDREAVPEEFKFFPWDPELVRPCPGV